MAVHRCRRCAGRLFGPATGRGAGGFAAPHRQCTAVQSSLLPLILAEVARPLFRQYDRSAHERRFRAVCTRAPCPCPCPCPCFVCIMGHDSLVCESMHDASCAWTAITGTGCLMCHDFMYCVVCGVNICAFLCHMETACGLARGDGLRACGPAQRHTQARRAARQVSFVVSTRGATHREREALTHTEFTERQTPTHVCVRHNTRDARHKEAHTCTHTEF